MTVSLFRKKDAKGQEYGGFIHEFRVGGGKSKRIYTQTEDRAAAEEIVDREKAKIIRQITTGEGIEMTLKLGMETYLREGVELDPEITDKKGVGVRLKKTLGLKTVHGEQLFSLDATGHCHKLTTKIIGELRRQRIDEGSAVATINRELSQLRRMLNWLKANKGVLVNPDLKFEMYRTEGRPRALDQAEAEAMIVELNPVAERFGLPPLEKRPKYISDILQDAYDLAIVLLDHGPRYGEACYLGPENINVDRRTMELYRPKVKNESVLVMSDRVCEIMERRLSKHPRGIPFIFPGRAQDGTPIAKMRSSNGTRGIAAAMDRAGLNTEAIVKRRGTASVVTLRHTFATWLLQDGMSDKQVATLLGHSDTKMVNKHYGHLLTQNVSETAAKLMNERSKR